MTFIEEREALDWAYNRITQSFLSSVDSAVYAEKEKDGSYYVFHVPVELNEALAFIISYYESLGIVVEYDKYSHKIKLKF